MCCFTCTEDCSLQTGEMLPGTLVAFVAAYDWIVPALDGYIDLHIDFRRKKSNIVRVFGVFADAVTAGDSVADVRRLEDGARRSRERDAVGVCFVQAARHGSCGCQHCGRTSQLPLWNKNGFE